MFYKMIYKRSFQKYKKSYINILCIFILSLSLFSFTNIYCDSYANHYDAVVLPILTKDHTCDLRVSNITEEEAELFSNIRNVEMEYIDGNLDFFLIDTNKIEEVHQEIVDIFNKYIFNDMHSADSPGVYVFFGQEIPNNSDEGMRTVIFVLQIVFSILGIVSMEMVYSDYINRRADDIRTLSGVGISQKQLYRLFWDEYNIVYLISLVIGIPIGGLIVYLFCKICEWTDMSLTNAIYLVFDVDFFSLVLTILFSYIVVNISFLVVLKRILKMDASYTCADTVVEFKPDKSRFLYYRSKRSFRHFFLSVLQKRSTNTYGVLGVFIAFILMASVFLLNGTSYAVTMYDMSNSAELAAFISNFSLFIVLIIYAIVFSWIVIYVFTKRQMESCSETVKTLYILGADEKTIYSCFRRLMIRRVFVTELFGIILGFAATSKIFEKFGYPVTVNAWLTVGIPVLIIAYWIVYLFSLKKNFMKNCRNFASDETGG